MRDNGSHKIDALADDGAAAADKGGKKDKTKDTAADKDDPIAKATEGMPQQAVAASEKAKETVKGSAEKIADKVKGAAEAVLDLVDDDGGVPDHSEL